VPVWIFEPGHTAAEFRARHSADLESTGAIVYYREIEALPGSRR
jgi:hypothetical protein